MAYVTTDFDSEIEGLLNSGGVGFMPSDTIYGLSAVALNQQAVVKLHRLKNRQASKPFIILFSDTQTLNKLSINVEQTLLAQKYWPGGLTLICDAPNSPPWLHLGFHTLAIRKPNNQKLLELIEKTGPIISTSANPEALVPAKNVTQATAYFGDSLDFYVDWGDINEQPSTLVRQKDGKLEVIRPGVIKIEGG